MGKMLAGLFVGVFVGALAYELVKKTEIARTTARKVSEGLHSAKDAFSEGYQSVEQPSPQSA
jgi:uncharacterized membrane-anchored protein YhcB (DUF1043 family)